MMAIVNVKQNPYVDAYLPLPVAASHKLYAGQT